ncbi:MAG: DnaJ C-terminal domain-containing protein [Rhodospirillaceae bacterium]
MKDPYQLLGVARDATQEQIRAAYRKLAKEHHPDLNPGNKKAEDRFKAIASAYELLSDEQKRGRFDRGEIDASGQETAPRHSYRDYADGAAGHRYDRTASNAGGWTSEDLGDIFGSMFNEGRGFGDAPLRGRDEHYTLATGFLDAINGATRRLTLPDGRTLDVDIPAGTNDRQVLRLRGQGGAGWKGGAPGDALIQIHVSPHPHFERDGRNIRLEVPISLPEAVLGAHIDVLTPSGPVRMRVPPQSDSGTKLRLRGKGVPAHGGHDAGDLHVTLRVVLGAPDAALEEFCRNWKPERARNPRQAMDASS